MFNRNAIRWSAVAALACFLLLTGLSTADAKKQGKAAPEKAKVAAKGEAKKAKEHGKAKADEKAKEGKKELKDAEKEARKEADEPKGKGLALGKDKEPGEGLALGKDKAKGPGKGLQLGKGHTGLQPGMAGKPALVSASKKRGPIVAEQRKHRRRLAKLQRLTVVASEQNNQKLLTKVQELQKKEQQRHLKKMSQLRMHAKKGKGKAKGFDKPTAQGKKLGHAKGKAGEKKEK